MHTQGLLFIIKKKNLLQKDIELNIYSNAFIKTVMPMSESIIINVVVPIWF